MRDNMNNKSGKRFLTILEHPNDILRSPNTEVTDFSAYRPLVVNMVHTMNKVKGVGIPAPQIGENIRLFIALIDKQPIVVFNPKILEESEKIITLEEGCLSVPGQPVKMTRPFEILVEFQDLKGRTHNRTLEGMNSIIFLHEFDHVLSEGGRLIIDYKATVA